jgi:hypothetical protein
MTNNGIVGICADLKADGGKVAGQPECGGKDIGIQATNIVV